MKRIIAAAFFALTLLTVQAGGDVTAQASDIARRMMSEIKLNESEYIQVRRCTIEKLETIAQVQKMYSNDPDMQEKKINEAEDSYNHKLQSIMNPKQYTSYLAVSDNYKTNVSAVAGNVEE